jgi:hypothetical protein
MQIADSEKLKTQRHWVEATLGCGLGSRWVCGGALNLKSILLRVVAGLRATEFFSLKDKVKD